MSDTPKTDELRRTWCAADDYFEDVFALAEHLEGELNAALAAVRALVDELDGYAMVHGADEDDRNALALGREVLARNKEVRQ